MESGDEGFGEDVVGKAVRAASLARSAKKKAEKAAREALEVARKEMKRKGKMIDLRKAEAVKKTMRSYFQSTRLAGGGQPLSLVFDGSMPEVPGAEPNSAEEYLSDDSTRQLMAKTRSRSMLLTQSSLLVPPLDLETLLF